MSITGDVREFKKKVGFFEFKPKVFNPTLEQIEKLGGYVPDEEPEYTGEKDGIQTVEVKVYGEVIGHKGVSLIPKFKIMDKEVYSERKGKWQYINNVGDTAWAQSEEELKDFFLNFITKEGEVLGPKKIRKALVGEAGFYQFLRNWLKINFYRANANLVISKKDLFNGNFQELQDLVGQGQDGSVVAVATVRTYMSDGDKKEIQSVHNNHFLPGSDMKWLRINGAEKGTRIEKFLKEISDPEYGIKDYFVADLLQDYDPALNVPAGDRVVIPGEEKVLDPKNADY